MKTVRIERALLQLMSLEREEKVRYPVGLALDELAALKKENVEQQETIEYLSSEVKNATELVRQRNEENERLRKILATSEASVLLLLDQVDYTTGRCRVNEMVGAVLPTEVIALVRTKLNKKS